MFVGLKFGHTTLLVVLAAPLAAQTFTLRVLNGKSGRPMASRNVTFHWISGNTVIRTNRDGEAEVTPPEGEQSFSLSPGPKDGKDPYRIAYIDCNATGRPTGRDQPSDVVEFPVKEVVEQGVVPFNWCSKRTRHPTPGVAVFWGRPIPWYIPDMQ